MTSAPKSSHITPIRRSPYWLQITERIEYKLLSLTYKVLTTTNVHICITSSQFSLLAALALHLWSHSLVHPHHLLYKLQIVPSSMLPLVSRINSRLTPQPRTNLSNSAHPVFWVALLPSVPSTHHFHQNVAFLQILPTIAYIFFFRTDSADSPDCLPILLSISVFTF